MSLPTYAFFHDDQDEVIARHFVNVGWWLTPENFAEAVMGLPVIAGTAWISLYGIRVEGELLGPVDGVPSWKEIREMIINAAPGLLKEFNQDVELRKALQAVYWAHEKKDSK